MDSSKARNLWFINLKDVGVMENRLANIANDAYHRHFEGLQKTGYRPADENFALLILGFLDDIMGDDFGAYIVEEDKRVIAEVIKCLGKKFCIIDFDLVDNDDSLQGMTMEQIFRATEDGKIRPYRTVE